MKKNIATNNRKMKTLKQIQSENRKAIIMANNPKAKTYEEALEMELGLGCLVKTTFPFPTMLCYRTQPFDDEKLWKEEGGYWVRMSVEDMKPKNKSIVPCQYIIGKPLTLSRVLIASGLGFLDHCLIKLGNISGIEYGHEPEVMDVCEWDLTKETIEEQSEETQREINKILNKKNDKNN